MNHKYNFIHDLNGILSLCRALGAENTGILLDSWHWYMSRETMEDIMRLGDRDVVYVHVNVL